MNVITTNRLLIIDDDTGVGATLGRIARRSGFEVIVTDDPKDFMARAEQWQPSVVVVDLVMPEVDGIQILRQLAESHNGAHVLLVSGMDSRVLHSAVRLGEGSGLRMAGVIAKPFRIEEVHGILSRLALTDPTSPGRLRAAIEAGHIGLHYQPKFDLRTRRICGAEALARWNDPAEGNIPPSVFIPAAERHGIMPELTRHILEIAVRQQRTWAAQDLEIDIAVNLSLADVETGTFPQLFESICREHGGDPRNITFEVTESLTMRNERVVAEALTRLRMAGAKLSIDDFGTGYSSLVQLHRLPFGEIKIDRSFVHDATTSRESRIIVKTIIDLAHNLDLIAVAEGVETEEHLQLLQELDCDVAQGYHIARPAPADEIAGLLPSSAR